MSLCVDNPNRGVPNKIAGPNVTLPFYSYEGDLIYFLNFFLNPTIPISPDPGRISIAGIGTAVILMPNKPDPGGSVASEPYKSFVIPM